MRTKILRPISHDMHKFTHPFLLIVIWGIFLMSIPIHALAQKKKIAFESYGVAEGLPEESIRAIVQDEQGFIWAATQNGLAKYDGYEFKVFGYPDQENREESLRFRNLTSLIKGRDDKLWMTSFKPHGIASFNPINEQFEHYLFNPDDSLSMPFPNMDLIFEDLHQNIWFRNGSNDTTVVCRLDQKTGRVHSYPYWIGSITSNDILINGRMATSKMDSSVWLRDDATRNILRWNQEKDSFEVIMAANQSMPGLNKIDTLILIIQSNDGHILIGGRKGVYVWNPVTFTFDHHFEYDPDDDNSLLSSPVQHVFEDNRGYFWAVHYNKGLTIIDPENYIFTRYEMGKEPLILPGLPKGFFQTIVTTIDDKGIWFTFIPNFGAYLYYDYKTKSFQIFDGDFNHSSNQFPRQVHMNNFIFDYAGLLWLGFRPNLYREAPKLQTRELFTHDPENEEGLPSDFITSFYEDRSGNFWVGTDQGLARFDFKTNQFQLFRPNSNGVPPLENYLIIQMYEDQAGNLWIGTNKGLFSWNPFRKQLRSIPFLNSFIIFEFMQDKDQRLWVSTQGKGVYVLDSNTGQLIKKFVHDSEDPHSLAANIGLIKIIQDSKDQIWLAGYGGSEAGLYRVDKDEKKLIPYKHLPDDSTSISSNRLNFIKEDSKGRLWVGTDDEGTNLYDPITNQFIHFYHTFDFRSTNTFIEDRQGQIFIGTYSGGGLAQIDPETKKIQLFGEKDGLLHNDIEHSQLQGGLIIYSHNRLWIPSSRGLSAFHTETKEITTYFKGEGFIPHLWPFHTPVYQTKDQSIWISCKAGLYRIFPDRVLAKDSIPPKIVITGMEIEGRAYSAPDSQIFQQAVSYTKKIELDHDQKDLTFEFVALHYLDAKENEYSWKLEPYQKEWTVPSKERSASYTNLDPGTYTFRVKAANADGIWNEEGASMIVVISPPWWATWWARIIFLIFILGIGYAIYRYQLSQQLSQAENKRLKELDNVKTRLYTNITHEFRTPLTVIQGMNEKMVESPQTWLEKGGDIVRRNSRQLLRLVSQMLDLSKLESGKLNLDLIQGDIIGYLQYLLKSFDSYAESKEIELVFYPEVAELSMDYDEEKIQHIVSNLLSNAIKFSPEGSNIILHVNQDKKDGKESLLLKVTDKGIGIPEEKLPHIFDRFYQVDDSSTRKGEGTGIGLTLTKELVELMDGKIDVESTVDVGTTFLVWLPINRNAPLIADTSRPEAPAVALPTSQTPGLEALVNNEGLPRVLIIEDNSDVILYIQSCLQDHYQLLTAENGAIGIDKALEHTPDLIISDVMMPEKDGFEVCQTLKRDERSSHIPIVLLTAKADLDSRLTGLQEGADAYLAKPFEKKELLVRIEQLIQLRRNLQTRYRNLHGAPIIAEEKYQREDGFLRKAKMVIEERLSDDDLSVEQLARELGMSRSQLFRKLKALTDKSAVAFIRSYRLGRARQLLKTTELSISEVAYEVGFKSPAHFSAAFLKEFGVQPSATRK